MTPQAETSTTQALRTDGTMVVHRAMQMRATPERIWRELETFERFAAWWDTAKDDRTETVERYEPRAGGWVELHIVDPNGFDATFEGAITVWNPPHELTWELAWRGAGWDGATLVTLRLTPNDSGTLVEILHYGFERIGAAGVDQFHGFGGGWDLRELQALRDVVENG